MAIAFPTSLPQTWWKKPLEQKANPPWGTQNGHGWTLQLDASQTQLQRSGNPYLCFEKIFGSKIGEAEVWTIYHEASGFKPLPNRLFCKQKKTHGPAAPVSLDSRTFGAKETMAGALAIASQRALAGFSAAIAGLWPVFVKQLLFTWFCWKQRDLQQRNNPPSGVWNQVSASFLTCFHPRARLCALQSCEVDKR